MKWRRLLIVLANALAICAVHPQSLPERKSPPPVNVDTNLCSAALAGFALGSTPVTIPRPFHLLAANSSFEEAKFIGIGDNHGDKEILRAAAGVINQYGREGDVVLLEGLATGQVVKQTEYFPTNLLEKSFVVMGWDDMPALEQSFAVLKDFMDLQSLETSSRKLRESELGQRLWKLTQTRNMSLAKTMAPLLLNKGPKVWLLAGAGHLDPNQSPLLHALSTTRSKHVLIAPNQTFDSSDLELMEHLRENERR